MCTSPLQGWRSRERNESGKRSIVFQAREGFTDRPVDVPCGRCPECKLKKKRDWALRCHHEASLHNENSWFALTYDDQHLPPNGSLRKSDLVSFLKDLRAHEQYWSQQHKRTERRFKFFACGEYGGDFDRPHYHCLLFGYDFADKRKEAKRGEHYTFDSDTLREIWGKGLTEIGELTFDSISYTAKYAAKRNRIDEESLRHNLGIEPEFLHMSRGGRTGRGIGYNWWQQYGRELRDHDTCILNGHEVGVPTYYDRLNEVQEPATFQKLKAHRKARIDPNEERSSRLLARQTVVASRSQLFTGDTP